MSDTQVSGSPAATPDAIVAPIVPVAAPVAAPVADENPPWLAPRLDQARRAALAELGITDPTKAKKLLEAAAKAEDDAKTTGEKLGATTAERDALKSEAERLRSVTAEWAGRQMMGLTAEQQAAVKAIAGDDAAAQLKTITALQPTWGKPAPLPGSAPIVPAPPAPPASGTAPAPNAPGGVTVSQQNPREVYASLQKTNPFAAAQYGLEHAREVFPDNN